eukprot:CAMPEP_0183587956 /NCGR_PEP_ID=MMETSP0371-20130417/159956_1 /TAXON_ID=268820 /ORGANISM="Peridinium aciculiferum, Strain PAER-2" /LENGTH=79 /DNA_ID=CAMNT_0025799183 /DNA_START=160 /DNA_END=400 /DNA_ORIENTATION=-
MSVAMPLELLSGTASRQRHRQELLARAEKSQLQLGIEAFHDELVTRPQPLQLLHAPSAFILNIVAFSCQHSIEFGNPRR